jgi:tRNA modification GTPase
MNLIVGREASIVSPEAGTTRDIVEASLDIRGYLCSFADTAGFRTTTAQPSSLVGTTGSAAVGGDGVVGAVEEEGIRRAKQKALESHIVIALASVESSPDGSHHIAYDAQTLQLAANAHQCLIVVNKCDTVSHAQLNALVHEFTSSVLRPIAGLEDMEPMTVSCREAQTADMAVGVPDPGRIHSLISRLAGSFSALTSLPEDMQDLLGVTERQKQLLERCRLHLEEFMNEASPTSAAAKDGEDHEADIVLAAEHLRFAASYLARITGRGEAGDVEEVLGVIFEKYYTRPLSEIVLRC